jgi:hypothetical protein
MLLSPALAALFLLAAAGAEDEGPCFNGSEMEPRGGPRGSLSAEEAASIQQAFDGVAGYRACVSYASLFNGFARGTIEFSAPDRIHWTVRHRPRQGAAVTLEAVRIGADTWYRTGAEWQRLPSGKKLAEAVPKVFIPAEPAELVRSFLEGRSKLVRSGEARGRAGSCVVWDNPAAPGGIRDAFCFGANDHLPHRYSGGGPAIEAYLQLELYDFGAKLEIRPPQ